MISCRILFVLLMMLGLGVVLAKHGQYKNEKYNFWVSLISCVLQVLLLWGGGFFS